MTLTVALAHSLDGTKLAYDGDMLGILKLAEALPHSQLTSLGWPASPLNFAWTLCLRLPLRQQPLTLTVVLRPRSQPQWVQADQRWQGHIGHPQAGRGAATLAADEPQVAHTPLELCMDFVPLLAFASAAYDAGLPLLVPSVAQSSRQPHGTQRWCSDCRGPKGQHDSAQPRVSQTSNLLALLESNRIINSR